MKFINPYFKVLDDFSVNDPKLVIEYSARNCYGSHDKITESSHENLVRALIEKKHMAMFEFGKNVILSSNHDFYSILPRLCEKTQIYKFIEFSYDDTSQRYLISLNPRTAWELIDFYKSEKWLYFNEELFVNALEYYYRDLFGFVDTINHNGFDFLEEKDIVNEQDKLKHVYASVELHVSRSSLAQITRHRINFSYAVSSMRFIDYASNNLRMIVPEWMNTGDFELDQEQKNHYVLCDYNRDVKEDWIKACVDSEANYKQARVRGLQKQQARDRLLSCTETVMVVKANLQAWKHFFELRTKPDADPEIRRISVALKQELEDRYKILL